MVAAVASAQGPAEPGEPALADIEVTLWRSVTDPSILYLSTRPEGGSWRTEQAPLDMARLSRSGRFHRSNAITVTVPLSGGGRVNVDVMVWRSVTNPSILYLSTRPEGGSWRTEQASLDMARLSRSGRFHQSNAVRVAVPLPTASTPTPTPRSVRYSGEIFTWKSYGDGWVLGDPPAGTTISAIVGGHVCGTATTGAPGGGPGYEPVTYSLTVEEGCGGAEPGVEVTFAVGGAVQEQETIRNVYWRRDITSGSWDTNWYLRGSSHPIYWGNHQVLDIIVVLENPFQWIPQGH